jgi:WD40 repeat protein
MTVVHRRVSMSFDVFAVVRVSFMLVAMVLGLAFTIVPAQSQNAELSFQIKHRVNAHGNEFNGLAKSSDGRRLFIATEKGEIIVWNIASRQAEQTLRQGSPVHFIVALSDPNEFIAAGSEHHAPLKAMVRKWNVETGAFVDLSGFDSESYLTALAASTHNGLVGLATHDGTVLAWSGPTRAPVATWKLNAAPVALAIVGKNLYVATLDRKAIASEEGIGESMINRLNLANPKQSPTQIARSTDRSWVALNTSPDNRLLSAISHAAGQVRTVLIDPASKAEIGSFDGSASVWIDASTLMLFSWLDPTEIVRIPRNGRATSLRKLKRPETDTRGRAFDLTGQVTTPDGSRAWATYRKGPGLLEFDLVSNKIRTLIEGPSGAYALSAVERNNDAGQLLTGGADGYVRLWNLADMSLVKEFHVAAPQFFVTDVHLLADGRRAVVGVKAIPKERDPAADPIEVLLLDLESGQQKKMFEMNWQARIAVVDNQVIYPEADRVKFVALDNPQNTRELKLGGAILSSAVSANSRWLAVVEEKTLSVFDLTTLQKKAISIDPADRGPYVVTNDGRYVYQIAHGGQLTKWDVHTGEVIQSVLSRIREMHSNVDFITVANDDQWLVTAGNHGDVGIFDRLTGRLVFYMQTSAAASYVEKVWISGNRMVLTTDTGVMFGGILK